MKGSYSLDNLEASKSFAHEFAKALEKESKNNIVVFMQGGLGAGKTTLIRELGLALGVKERITSPSFVGMNEYYSGKIDLIHVDLYQSKPDYESLSELLKSSNKKIIAIEWSENLDATFLELEKLETEQEHVRKYIINIDVDYETDTRKLKII